MNHLQLSSNVQDSTKPSSRSRKKLWIIIGALAVVLIVVASVVYVANRAGAAPLPPNGPNVTVWDTGFCSNSGNCGYSPTIKNVTSGISLTWTNTGNQAHTVTECISTDSSVACPSGAGANSSGSRGFDSNTQTSSGFAKNQQYQYAINLSPGAYYYYCTLHAWMHGTIVVS
ncbi:MAG TPA: plastocyanin/azurin family copper-binding protein [Candidatus Bathyarchaeia archaeon]|nr:plastocyanin/azurin family copper-binding protein [Candidatus Bathyarchaeia archaeon]